MLILYGYDSNFIHVELMPNKSGAAILAAYKWTHTIFSAGDCNHNFNAWTMKPPTSSKNS